MQKTIAALELKQSDLLLDIGGGTGIFTEAIARQAKLQNDALCLDSSAEMLKQAEKRPGVASICKDADSFLKSTSQSFDKILLKEIIHDALVVIEDLIHSLFSAVFFKILGLNYHIVHQESGRDNVVRIAIDVNELCIGIYIN